jgi:hypothetical protein
VDFQALQLILNPDWEMVDAATSDANFDHLVKYAEKIKDVKFKHRIIDAVDLYYRCRDDYKNSDSMPIIFDCELFQVQRVDNVAEVGYGFYFKDTVEYGLYRFFVDDDTDKTYYSYFRSDNKFENEVRLDARIEFDGPFSSELN